MKAYRDIDTYFKSAPKETVAALRQMRATIHKAVPSADEAIRYGMPTFRLNGKNLVHFAGWKTHIGFYPASSGVAIFAKELLKYDVSKGTVRFRLDKPLPLGLIAKIVKYRVKETLAHTTKGK